MNWGLWYAIIYFLSSMSETSSVQVAVRNKRPNFNALSWQFIFSRQWVRKRRVRYTLQIHEQPANNPDEIDQTYRLALWGGNPLA